MCTKCGLYSRIQCARFTQRTSKMVAFVCHHCRQMPGSTASKKKSSCSAANNTGARVKQTVTRTVHFSTKPPQVHISSSHNSTPVQPNQPAQQSVSNTAHVESHFPSVPPTQSVTVNATAPSKSLHQTPVFKQVPLVLPLTQQDSPRRQPIIPPP